jgi:hypothetical protein
MGMNSKTLFRPGRGSVIEGYTAAFSDGATGGINPGDWLQLSTTDPTAQGVSGVIQGETLGATDYVECTAFITTGLGCGTLCLGVSMGKSITAVSNWSDVSGQVYADGDLVIIQRKGIHPVGRQVTGAVLGNYLQASTIAGECVNEVSGTVTGSLRPVGVAMESTGVTYTNSAGTENGTVVFVDC